MKIFFFVIFYTPRVYRINPVLDWNLIEIFPFTLGLLAASKALYLVKVIWSITL